MFSLSEISRSVDLTGRIIYNHKNNMIIDITTEKTLEIEVNIDNIIVYY